MEWETVSVPFSGGVDLRLPGRTVEPQRLLRLQNGRFDANVAGIRKRRGHVGHAVRDFTAPDGSGLPSEGGIGSEPVGGSTTIPDAAQLYGMAKRDEEVLAWDGTRLFSWPPGVQSGAGWQEPIAAVMPHLTSAPLTDTVAAQKQFSVAIGRDVAVAAWVDVDENLHYTVYDPTTWAIRARVSGGEGVTSVVSVRTVASGDWVHVLYCDGTSLHMASFHPTNVEPSTPSVAECAGQFDVRQVTDDLFLVGYRNGSDEALITYFNADGTTNNTYASAGTVLDTGAGAEATVVLLSVCHHPDTAEIALIWTPDATSTEAYLTVYDSGGTNPGSRHTVTTSATNITQVTIAPVETSSGKGSFRFAYSDPTDRVVVSDRATKAGILGGSSTLRHSTLAGHAFSVGVLWFMPVVKTYAALYNSTSPTRLQRGYYLIDESHTPVGRYEYGTADDTTALILQGFCWDADQVQGQRTRWHGGLTYKVRVDARDENYYDEPSGKRLTLDFLPKLAWAQQGRSTYFAGAQLWEYDGDRLREAGHLEYPDNCVPIAGAATANTLEDGTYDYKVRAVRKNAQGEEVMSASVTTTSVLIAGGPKKVTLHINTLPYSRYPDDTYFNVYRREATGSSYYLVSSRDPEDSGDNGYAANDPSVDEITFSDALPDDDLLGREREPGDAGTLHPFAPPASTVIGAGRDRLWLAGGEIPAGDVLPSLLFESGQAAQFTQFLQTTVDRGHSPVTGFGFMGHSAFVFKADKTYAFEADGPNNLGQGGFDYPRLIASDTGAIDQAGIVLTPRGLLFQSLAGVKLLATNYQVMDAGDPVKTQMATADVRAALVVPGDQEVRFYTTGDAYVYDYSRGEWAVWTGLGCRGAVLGPNRLAIVGKSNGRMLVETEDTWLDDDLTYDWVSRTAWLSASGPLSFWRVRELAVVGDLYGDHVLRCRVYYNDRDWPEDEWTWDPASDLNTSLWGDLDWGDGVWGDVNSDGVSDLLDRTYEFRRRLARQKCARVSFEFSDQGANSEGPALTAISLQVGRRAGHNRTAARTFS